MGVPAFYRWITEKYPKVVQDVLQERVRAVDNNTRTTIPFDSTKPNPSGLECDNLYIDMNGIIHPCSHPEQGAQPQSEEEMYENVCRYVDHLFRAIRPRKMLYLAIDGVAPRAKMNQQRSRRFRSAQEAREQQELEEQVRADLEQQTGKAIPPSPKPWDSNVITPGTPFMLRLSDFLRFYVRKRINTDKAWQKIRVMFSDASIPGEGEHKIMAHIRLQRSQPGYDPNLIHVLHGLDADLIMLALATHEAHFYISRELVLFGRKSHEQHEQRQLETGFKDAQKKLDEDAGALAMELPENSDYKPLQRLSIPILREYLAGEFASCITRGRIPFTPSFERLIDDIVFLCFFVGNDFLPHLPSLDIRDGALDFLFNVYKRLLPTLGDYITNHGGQINLSHVDVILAEVGAIEDMVFSMKHENEEREKHRKKEMQANRKQNGGRRGPPLTAGNRQPKKVMGRAARILERQQAKKGTKPMKNYNGGDQDQTVALKRGFAAKEEGRKQLRVSHMQSKENAKAAMELKKALQLQQAVANGYAELAGQTTGQPPGEANSEAGPAGADQNGVSGAKRNVDEAAEGNSQRIVDGAENGIPLVEKEAIVEDAEQGDDEDEDEEDLFEDGSPEVPVEEADAAMTQVFKDKVKQEKSRKLDEYARNVEDNVRLHESGWKDRYYKDKCKADDVTAHGGREHLFRSYVVGLSWVMKYYYDGCPSWKWYYPFHYAPFASDLRNIERFRDDCRSMERGEPFRPIEQLMAVLPEDSSHAIPKPSRWLMADKESPIIDFYPKDVPVDPNGKAMPWLWVVLLPFIEEDRLLSAMRPSMKEWTSTDHLCNARGMDDGYVYMHQSHHLSYAVDSMLREAAGSSAAKAMKVRLSASNTGVRGFSGSIRPPLSNELLPIANEDNNEDGTIDPPSGAAGRCGRNGDDVLVESIVGNLVLCAAFTEPAKLSHKSVLLPGVRPPLPSLTADDLVIRRPRLNRGGASIANLGGGDGASHGGKSYQSGYGSMNISSYERDLATRQGRGHQMYQAGTRSWGSMEPTPKRARPSNDAPAANPYPSNPFHRQPQQQQQTTSYSQQQESYSRPPWQQQSQHQYRQSSSHTASSYNNNSSNSNNNSQQYQYQRQSQYQQPQYQQQQQQQQSSWQNHSKGSSYQNQSYKGGQQQQQQQQQSHHGYQQGYQSQSNQYRSNYHQQTNYQQSYQQNGQQQSQWGGQHNRPYTTAQHRQQQQQQQQQQGYSFQGMNRSSQPGQQLQQQQQSSRSRGDPNFMNNLRSQLANTLQQNRHGRQSKR